jgi:hypothetical protein
VTQIGARNRKVDGIFLGDNEQGEIGHDLFRAACSIMGFEGIVSKHRNRTDRAGNRWVNAKNRAHPAYNRVRDLRLRDPE